jgi:hypothetical protein
MELLVAGLAGVVVGAVVASAIILHLFQKRSDRDLIERRLRACFDYRECLGDFEGAFAEANGDARIAEQAWHNVAAFCRELRRTGWLFRPSAPAAPRRRRGSRAGAAHSRHERRNAGGRAAQILCEMPRARPDPPARTEEQAKGHRGSGSFRTRRRGRRA